MAVPCRAGLPVGRWKAGLLILFLACGVDAADTQPPPKRVLLFHTYAQDSAPYDVAVAALRRELAQRWRDGLAVYDAALETGRPAVDNDAAIVSSLRARFAGTPLDLVVPIGAPAARFYMAHRSELFGSTPVHLFSIEERIGRELPLQRGDGVVGVRMTITPMVETIRALLPGTETIAVVLGDSPLERFWLEQVKRELAPLEGHVRFEWLNKSTLPAMRERVAALPPHSAVLFLLLQVDAAGTPFNQQDALSELRAVSAAPIFGVFESELGEGIVGGPLTPQAERGAIEAQHAVRTLSGQVDAAPFSDYLDAGLPTFDGRELARWHIPESRLPPGSIVRFQTLSLWREYRNIVIAGCALVVLQGALITLLILQHRRLRRAQNETFAMSGRIMTAHEDERRRLARELHDDVTQRLARLAIDAAQLESRTPQGGRATLSVHGELVRLGEDVHALSYRLHPSILDDLGLAEALRSECEQISRREALHLEIDLQDLPHQLPSDAALCIFRVAQEALRNIARHAKAHVARVLLDLRDGGIFLSVADDGIGFDAGDLFARHSLGHVGMRERVRLLGGRVEIDSERGKGTTVVAWVPAKVAA